MQFSSELPDIKLTANFQSINPDVSRTEGGSHMIYIFFGSPLSKVQLWQVQSL